jgi:hypothetical protein
MSEPAGTHCKSRDKFARWTFREIVQGDSQIDVGSRIDTAAPEIILISGGINLILGVREPPQLTPDAGSLSCAQGYREGVSGEVRLSGVRGLAIAVELGGSRLECSLSSDVVLPQAQGRPRDASKHSDQRQNTEKDHEGAPEHGASALVAFPFIVRQRHSTSLEKSNR